MGSPTQRSLAYLRKRGWICRVVASWNAFAHKRHDVLSADILAFDTDNVLLVNATDATSVSKHEKKALADPDVVAWLQRSNRQFVVMGWRKDKRGDDGLIWRAI